MSAFYNCTPTKIKIIKTINICTGFIILVQTILYSRVPTARINKNVQKYIVCATVIPF